MQISSPSRETVLQALNARTSQLIQQGDLHEAQRVREDMVTLKGAPGDDLYEMYRIASEKADGFPRASSVGEYLSQKPGVGFALGAAGVVGGMSLLLGAIPPPIPGAIYLGAGLLGAGAIGVGVIHYRVSQARRHNEILNAVDRHQSFIHSFTPSATPPELQIDRRVFLAGLQGQEGRLAEKGEFARAVEMRKVHQALEKLPGETVEELFGSLLASKNHAVLNAIQGPLSGEVAETIETIAEVGKLVAPGNATVRDNGDTLTIGGVVLRKNKKAA